MNTNQQPLSVEEMNSRAKALYRGSTTGSAPRWEQLGDTTRAVWYERAYADLMAKAAGQAINALYMWGYRSDQDTP